MAANIDFFPDDLGNAGIYDRKKGGPKKLNVVKTVERLQSLTSGLMMKTPLYYYDILKHALNCDCSLKLENLQDFGEISPRILLSVILCNLLVMNSEPAVSSSEELLDGVNGVVLILSKHAPTLAHNIASLAVTAHKVLKLPVTLFVDPEELSLLSVVQIEMISHIEDAKIVFLANDATESGESSLAEHPKIAAARKHASEHNMLFIEPKFLLQFGLLGAATVMLEIYDADSSIQTILVPYRLYSRGWATVAGVSILAKCLEQSIRIVCVTSEEERLSDRHRIKRSLFPDLMEISWWSQMHPAFDISDCFDRLDRLNKGSIILDDFLEVLKAAGMKNASFTSFGVWDGSNSLNLTELMNHIYEEFSISGSRAFADNPAFAVNVTLEALSQNRFIDEIVSVNEQQAAQAFVRFLQYTHTVCDGRAAAAIAGLFSGKIKVHPIEKVCVLVTGGNIETTLFDGIVNYGMGLIGQNFNLQVLIPDDLESLSKILNVLATQQITIIDLSMDRSSATIPIHHVRITVKCHSRNFEMQQAAKDMIVGFGYDVTLEHHPIIRSRFDEVSKQAEPPQENGTSNGVAAGGSRTSISVGSQPEEFTEKSQMKQQKDAAENITVESIEKAYNRIKVNLVKTPIYRSDTYSKQVGAEVYLMLENIQNTGSFKIRGSSNSVLKKLEENPSAKPAGIMAASAGNHAQGVALVASKVKIPCTIACPFYAPETKLSFTRRYGAEVWKVGESLEETSKAARAECAKRGWRMVEPFNDWDVIEGQGTIGYEIYRAVPDLETILIGVGGGGLITGIASYLKKKNPKIRVVGVQSEIVSPLADFKKTHSLRYIQANATTIADGTNVKIPGGVHTKLLDELVDEYVTVSENEIAASIVGLLGMSRTLSEGAGCLTLAALITRKLQIRPGEKILSLVCGGNIDMTTLRQVYEYGLKAMGRSFTVNITISDKYGQLKRVIDIALQAHLKVREIIHMRGQADLAWSQTKVTFQFWAKSFEHQNRFLKLCVDQDIFPEIVGRPMIDGQETIYAEFDAYLRQHLRNVLETEEEKARRFKEEKGQTYKSA